MMRDVTKADLKGLARMNVAIFKDTDEKTALKTLEDSYRRRVRGACLVALEAGELVGAIFGERAIAFVPKAGFIRSFFVRGDQQGKGIGKQLLTGCLSAMKKAGIKSVSLTADDRNVSAISLYRKFGFEPYRALYLLRL